MQEAVSYFPGHRHQGGYEAAWVQPVAVSLTCLWLAVSVTGQAFRPSTYADADAMHSHCLLTVQYCLLTTQQCLLITRNTGHYLFTTAWWLSSANVTPDKSSPPPIYCCCLSYAASSHTAWYTLCTVRENPTPDPVLLPDLTHGRCSLKLL